MKKAIMSFLALAMTLGLMIALATPAQAAEVRNFKGLGAEAYWSLYDEDTGVYTDVHVYFFDGVFRSPSSGRETRYYAGIGISQYRYVDDEYTPIRDVYCFADPLSGGIAVERNLTSASLTASGIQGTQWDYASETETAVNIDINVSCTAAGPLSNSHYNGHWRYPSEFVFYHGTGKSREGSAAGVVTLDGLSIMLEVDNVDAGEYAYASISSTSDGHLGIVH
jgi:hypothetical protein